MRTIKFRAWDKENKSMRTSKHWSIMFDGSIHPPSNKMQEWFPDQFVLMQYTGLKDKNGKEIYEGDIVRSYGTSATRKHKNGDKLFDHVVEFFDGGFEPFTECTCTASWSIHEYEIIGNIYEHPELLKKKAQP